MNLIIPMAGRGTRLRPQTLTTPKPLIEIAGKKIVERIIELVKNNCSKEIKHVSFIISSQDLKTEKQLKAVCKSHNYQCTINYQQEALGTAHAIYCAKEKLRGPVLIIFADTLFETNFNFPIDTDGCIFVKQVDDPSSYGVIKKNEHGRIVEFIEKPTTNVSNLAIVGIYYFSNGQSLCQEIQEILENNIKDKGEYQITTALEKMKTKGAHFSSFEIDSWYDFGTPQNLIESHKKILQTENPPHAIFSNTTIIQPCYIAEGVEIIDSKIGPNVSIGANSKIISSEIKNTIIQSNCNISGASFNNSILGNHVDYDSNLNIINIGDYSKFK
ncbi:MAG: nucleotidyltransferase [Flavobacteriales bacterium]|nr:nucleotidyltransferase [Flavobacteriales bacterium]|tara:strand:- start:10279 stop:11265 length:987 start_codon:yes stop_codon:yes gene_type:complete